MKNKNRSKCINLFSQKKFKKKYTISKHFTFHKNKTRVNKLSYTIKFPPLITKVWQPSVLLRLS